MILDSGARDLEPAQPPLLQTFPRHGSAASTGQGPFPKCNLNTATLVFITVCIWHDLASEAEYSLGHISFTGTEMASPWVGKEKQPCKAEHEALSYVSYVGANRAGLASFGGSNTTRKSGRNRW